MGNQVQQRALGGIAALGDLDIERATSQTISTKGLGALVRGDRQEARGLDGRVAGPLPPSRVQRAEGLLAGHHLDSQDLAAGRRRSPSDARRMDANPPCVGLGGITSQEGVVRADGRIGRRVAVGNDALPYRRRSEGDPGTVDLALGHQALDDSTECGLRRGR